MADAKEEFRAQIERGVEDLRTMRDEILLKLRLGGMDAREAWKKLEPKFDRLEQEARHVKDDVAGSVREAISDLKGAFEELHDRLKT